jgi:hypothetical protein
MIDWTPALAIDADRIGIVVRGLAVVGSGVLGGFGIGLLLQGAAKLMTGQKVPRTPLQLVRVLGAVTTGWAAFLLMAGSGGSGFGGPGGNGILPGGGEGSGSETRSHSASESSVASDTSSAAGSPSYPADAHVIQVEVLDVTDPVNQTEVFRIKDTKRSLSLADLKDKLSNLRKKDMPKLDTVDLKSVGKNPPSEFSGVMQGLKQWADDEGIAIKGP